jgi:hypothetical protein
VFGLAPRPVRWTTMPSKKQRRRRQKERRHDYEFVYVDEHGDEVEAAAPTPNGSSPPAESRPKRDSSPPARGSSSSRAGAKVRQVDPPSWRRVGKRALIFAPLMFVSISLLDRSLGAAGQVLVTLQMLVIFVPFSYLVDRAMYRRYVRQAGAGAAAPSPRRGGGRGPNG